MKSIHVMIFQVGLEGIACQAHGFGNDRPIDQQSRT